LSVMTASSTVSARRLLREGTAAAIAGRTESDMNACTWSLMCIRVFGSVGSGLLQNGPAMTNSSKFVKRSARPRPEAGWRVSVREETFGPWADNGARAPSGISYS